MSRTAVDRALEWCTIAGEGSREQFDQAAIDLVSGQTNAVLSGLELVGHIEVDWEHTGRWSINPPVLALPEGSGGNACWIGGRTEGTLHAIETLRESHRVESFMALPGGSKHASTWYVGCRSLDQLNEAAAEVGATVTVDPASLLMYRFLDLDQILSTRKTEYAPSGFRAKQLNVQTMRYEPIDVMYANWPAGCFEQLSNGRRKYVFVDEDDVRYVCDRWVATHAEIRRQRRAGRVVPPVLQWDMSMERMVVFAEAQLPTRWARAAALCSGLPPRRVEGTRWIDVYEGVRALMFGRFCNALEMAASSTDLSKYDKEPS